MSPPDRPAVVVVDTSVISTELDDRLRGRRQDYDPHLRGRSLLLSFQTVTELHYGALRAGWGELRTRRLQRLLTEETRPVESDPKMAAIAARLRVDCERIGHALAAKEHEGDRWVAATAIRLGVPLVAHDGIFFDAPGLQLITELPRPK
jgi:predicted nucleic acid-binding protein